MLPCKVMFTGSRDLEFMTSEGHYSAHYSRGHQLVGETGRCQIIPLNTRVTTKDNEFSEGQEQGPVSEVS